MSASSRLLTFGVGTFTLSAAPTTIPINSGTQQPYTTLTAKYQDGYSNTLDVTCSGLPTGATCDFLGALYPANTSAQLSLTETGLASADYPFTITASGGMASRSIPAILRVESYSASLSQTSIKAQSGAPVSVTVNFQSVNHFTTSSIQISCQAPSNVACNPTPYNAVLTDGGTAAVQVGITATYSNVAATNVEPPRSAALWWRPIPCLAALLLPFAMANGRARRILLSLCIFGIFTLMGACGGGQSGTGGVNGKSQTITIQLNASGQTAGNGPLNQTIGTVTLKVTE